MKSVAVFTLVCWTLCEAVLAGPPIGESKSAHSPRDAVKARGPDWEIFFDDDVLGEEYARQIDYFKIEIAAVSKKGRIDYISQVTKPKPERRVGHKATDYRFNTTWKAGRLHAADRKLLAKAGISTEGKELVHYFPSEVQSQLSKLELAYAQRQPSEIKRTRFQIRPKSKEAGYEFIVIEQDPPKPAESTASPASRNQPVER
jgi:hypothetical protein